MLDWLFYSDISTYVFSILGGVIAGLYGSMVGSGSLVSFPVLILLGLPTSIAIATNRLAVVWLEVSAALRFRKQIRPMLHRLLLFGFIAAVGSFLGATFVGLISQNILNVIAAIALLLVLVVLLLSHRLGRTEATAVHPRMMLFACGVFVLGLYGGFFGAGFGTFLLMLFVATGHSYMQGAAFSRMIGLVMSSVATLTFAYHGMIDYPLGISLGVGYAIGGWIGAGLGIQKGNGYVRALLFVVIAASIVKLLF